MITIKEYTEQLETENRTLYEDKNYWKKLAEKRKYQLQQKENIIKEVREYIEPAIEIEYDGIVKRIDENTVERYDNFLDNLKQILDKENK